MNNIPFTGIDGHTFTAPHPLSRQSTGQDEYMLVVRQQPKHSRSCGYGEKVDRRPIDPPPVVQFILQKKNPATSPNLDSASAQAQQISQKANVKSFTKEDYLSSPFFFMYCSLCSKDGSVEVDLLRDGKTRATTGSIVSSLYKLRDIDHQEGAFFVFPDLSVRVEGEYTLKFCLFEIVGDKVLFRNSIHSDVFRVYPAKQFPGMEESTELSKVFAEQGLKIRVRKELRSRKKYSSNDSVASASSSTVQKTNLSRYSSGSSDAFGTGRKDSGQLGSPTVASHAEPNLMPPPMPADSYSYYSSIPLAGMKGVPQGHAPLAQQPQNISYYRTAGSYTSSGSSSSYVDPAYQPMLSRSYQPPVQYPSIPRYHPYSPPAGFKNSDISINVSSYDQSYPPPISTSYLSRMAGPSSAPPAFGVASYKTTHAAHDETNSAALKPKSTTTTSSKNNSNDSVDRKGIQFLLH